MLTPPEPKDTNFPIDDDGIEIDEQEPGIVAGVGSSALGSADIEPAPNDLPEDDDDEANPR